MSDRMPKWVVPALVLFTAVSLIPFALAAKSRASKSPRPRIQIIPDMDQAPSFGPQQVHPLFADGRAMRPHVPGTVARGELREDDHFFRGKVNGEWAKTFPEKDGDGNPLRMTMAFLERGRERYEIFCSSCHGLGVGGVTAGGGQLMGNGIVDQRATELEQPLWIPPPRSTRTRSGVARSATSTTRSRTASARCRATARRSAAGSLGHRGLPEGPAAEPAGPHRGRAA
jgi:hypothetical protein